MRKLVLGVENAFILIKWAQEISQRSQDSNTKLGRAKLLPNWRRERTSVVRWLIEPSLWLLEACGALLVGGKARFIKKVFARISVNWPDLSIIRCSAWLVEVPDVCLVWSPNKMGYCSDCDIVTIRQVSSLSSPHLASGNQTACCSVTTIILDHVWYPD